MPTPKAKKGRTILISSDACPRNCRTGTNGAIHLMSDHDDSKANQCNLCSCVVQDVHDVKPG